MRQLRPASLLRALTGGEVLHLMNNEGLNRLLALWCPDWPVVAAADAAGISVMEPAAVVRANRVLACSPQARNEGVGRGMTRRDAQGRCPELVVLEDDPGRDARLFEPIAAAVERLAVGVEVVRPGIVAVPVEGAAGYHGGEAALAELLVDQVATETGVESQVGIADGLFAATLAARRGLIIAPGESAQFLAPLPITELDQPESDRTDLVELLKRLGIRHIGAFAALSERDVANRFNRDGIIAHRLARGLSERPPNRRRPAPDLAAAQHFDPPIDRVDHAAFAAKTLGSTLHTTLAGHGLACTRLLITATTETGEEYARAWRTAEPLTAQGITDRTRWQLDSWLTRSPEDRPTSGIVELRLHPEETISGESQQMTLHAGDREADAEQRAARAMVRVQGLLGPESVYTPVLQGGRSPGERVRLVPWGDPLVPAADPAAPWPGRLPEPSPATVLDPPITATVLDASGQPVDLVSPARLSQPPSSVSVTGQPARTVVRWAGPWPTTATWWTDSGDQQGIRIQVLLTDDHGEVGVLLRAEPGGSGLQWTVEGVYD